MLVTSIIICCTALNQSLVCFAHSLVFVVAIEWRHALGHVVWQGELVLAGLVRLDLLGIAQLVQMVVGSVLHDCLGRERLQIGQRRAHIETHFVANQRIQAFRTKRNNN